MPKLVALQILLISIILMMNKAALASVEITSESDRINLTPYLTYYEDRHSTLNLTKALQLKDSQGFKTIDDQIANFGVTKSTFWLSLKLHSLHQTKTPKNYLVELATPYLDSVTFYVIQKGKISTTLTGDQQPFSSRPFESANFIVPIWLENEEQIEIVIRVKTDGAITIPLTLWTPEAFTANKSESQLTYGAYYGVMIAMALYNLLIFLYTRRVSYFYYILFVMSLTLYQAGLAGHTFMYLWPNSGWLANHSFTFTALSAVIFGTLFTQSLLETKKHFIRIHSILNTSAYIGLGLLIASLFMSNDAGTKIASLYVVCCCVFAIFIGAIGTQKRIPLASFYFMAWSILVVCAIFQALIFSNIMNPSTTGIQPIMIGAAIEVFLLSAALARQTSLAQLNARTILKVANEELISSNKIKDDFFATISHELRTPINGVTGALYLLESCKLPTEAKAFTKAAAESSQEILSLADNLSIYAESNHYPKDAPQQVFSVSELFTKIRKAHQDAIRIKGLKLETSLDKDVHIVGDKKCFTIILDKLVDNAIKFTQIGKISIESKIVEAKLQGYEHSIQLTVSDTGIGIPDSTKNKIFTPFQQSQQPSRGYKGLGIGLSICYNLLQHLEGELELTSRVGRGTTFTVTIPCQTANEEFVERIQKQKQDTQIDSELGAIPRGIQVLVVEDNVTNQMLLGSMLKRQGCQVNFASNGREAINQLSHVTPDIIFMDCRMPVMDGLEATQTIRKARTPSANVPIVAITANATLEDKERCFAAGMSDYIAKPYVIDEIKRMLQLHGPTKVHQG